jgi:hypothetical protein
MSHNDCNDSPIVIMDAKVANQPLVNSARMVMYAFIAVGIFIICLWVYADGIPMVVKFLHDILPNYPWRY